MKYRKKPVVVEAFRIGIDRMPDWFLDKVSDKTVTLLTSYRFGPFSGCLTSCDIKTLEGTMRANYGDYVIKGVRGELYPCKPDIFDKTYEAVDPNNKIDFTENVTFDPSVNKTTTII